MKNYLELTKKLMENKLKNYRLIVVSDGEPYMHIQTWEGIKCNLTAGGLAIALDPVLQACQGIWIARGGSGNADKRVVNMNGEVKVPPELELYTLKRIFINKEEYDGYYNGFSNQGMWPLCHQAYQKPKFNPSNYEYYKIVNKKFADAIIEESKSSKPLIYTQDFQLMFVPKYIRETLPKSILGHFWHIPWPSPYVFKILPWYPEVLSSLLMNDFIGFHTQEDCRKFLLTVDELLPDYTIDFKKSMVLRNSNRTWVINCPISVDYNSISNRIKEEKVIKEKERIQSNFGEVMLGVGVDRIDYTKGLIEKFDAIDRFFEKYPEYKEKVVFVQMAVLDKVRVREYEELGYKIDEMVDKINWKYGTDTWSPIEYIKARVPFDRVLAMYNKAKFCLISSLDDGLNIVSKEFVSAQNLNDPGVLLLSEFAGASQEFKNNGAIIINPYDTEHCADTIRQAIKMKDYERKSRMRKLKKIVQENDIFKWSYNIFRAFYSIAERK